MALPVAVGPVLFFRKFFSNNEEYYIYIIYVNEEIQQLLSWVLLALYFCFLFFTAFTNLKIVAMFFLPTFSFYQTKLVF